MKIAIVENEKREVEGALEYLNDNRFKNSIIFEYFETSQQFLDEATNIQSFNAIIIDIHLTKKSHLDGFGLMKKLLDLYPDISGRIGILTGFHKVEAKIAELGLPSFPIIVKPARFNVILDVFKQLNINPEI